MVFPTGVMIRFANKTLLSGSRLTGKSNQWVWFMSVESATICIQWITHNVCNNNLFRVQQKLCREMGLKTNFNKNPDYIWGGKIAHGRIRDGTIVRSRGLPDTVAGSGGKIKSSSNQTLFQFQRMGTCFHLFILVHCAMCALRTVAIIRPSGTIGDHAHRVCNNVGQAVIKSNVATNAVVEVSIACLSVSDHIRLVFGWWRLIYFSWHCLSNRRKEDIFTRLYLRESYRGTMYLSR